MNKYPWKAIILTMCLIVLGSWTAEVLRGEVIFKYFSPWFIKHNSIVSLIIILALLATLLGLYRVRNSFMSMKSLSQRRNIPHRGIVLLLTYPNIIPDNTPLPWSLTDRTSKSATITGSNLDDDIASLNSINYWNWQQILRGLVPHKTTLTNVIVIGSKESKEYYSQVKILINAYFPEVEVRLFTDEVDFEKFDKIVQAIESSVSIIEKNRITKRDIIIDITGGQKTASIGGAAVTLMSEVTFQYVQTNGPQYDVLMYDVVIQPPVSTE